MPSIAEKYHWFRDAQRIRSARTVKGDKSTLRRALTLAAMSLGYGVVQLDVTIVNTALNSIGTSLGGASRNCNGSSALTRLHLRL
jgi:hypothetical protein